MSDPNNELERPPKRALLGPKWTEVARPPRLRRALETYLLSAVIEVLTIKPISPK